MAFTKGRGWVVAGSIAPDRLREATGVELPVSQEEEPVKHLSDWACRQQSETLRGGEVIEKGSVRVVVRKVRRHKVLEAQVEVLSR